jgi:AraC family L-rhamnose operon transcriptional activator RhaR
MLDALEAIRSTPLGHRTRAAELGHLLVALDCLAGGEPTRASDAPERQATSPLVAQAKDLLEHDLAYPWTLTELSSRLYVGPFHLARQFVRSLGVPPMHYLARWRAMRAAALLAATDEPIAAVGAAVGWPDPSQFSRRFRAVFGVSPRTYRRRIRDGHGSTLDAEGDVARAS